MKEQVVRGPLILLFASAMLVSAFASSAGAGSVPSLIWMPPVGAARPTMPSAPGTITTPVTPTVPRGRTPGQSTITIPGVSGSGVPSTMNSGTVRPCGGGANAAGSVRGNAGIATAPGENPNNIATGVPNVPSVGAPDAGAGTTINPSVRAGVPSSC